MQAQQATFQTVLEPSKLPTAQGWTELRFDNTIPWEQATKDLLVSPAKLQVITGTALKLKAETDKDTYGNPLYSQLGYFLPRTGFSLSIGFTVEFKAKIVSENGAFTVSGVGAGKGFRLEFSKNQLLEHANVLDTVRVLSTASSEDGFHTYRVAVAPDNTVRVWRDNTLLGALPLQEFKSDNIVDDGGFENGTDATAHGWQKTSTGETGALTVSSDPAYVHTGKYGLLVEKEAYELKDPFPVKPGAIYDMTAWGKTIAYPDGDGRWRDLTGYHDPANDRTVYFVGDKGNKNWKFYEKQNMEGGAHFQSFRVATPTGDAFENQMAFDDIHYSERITASRIPAGAVNLFPNGDIEDPCFDYFPAGDPRNDTCIVNPNNYRYSAEAYYGGRLDNDEEWFGENVFSAEHNAAPFWHPFWGARVRVQYNRQTGNDEAGNHWARGKYSLRYFNCGGANVEYGNDFSGGINEDRGSNSDIKTLPINLEAGKKYTFLFSYHNAKYGSDGMNVVVKNGSKEIYRREAKGDNTFPDWRNEVIEFTADADNHALQILTERIAGNWEGYPGTPGVIYFDDLYLFEGELLPEDNTYLFFGKQTGTKGAEADIEYIKIDNTGAYDTSGNPIVLTYEKQKAPLMTVWGENLDVADPILNEYPRPQLKREGWTNLNGIWQYITKKKEFLGTYNPSESYRQEVLVPFPVESALSGVQDKDYANQDKALIYKREATIAKPADNKRVILHFGAVDWETYVFVNGQEVAHHKGGFDPFSADITDKLNTTGNQEIVVHVFDPTRGGQPSGKQTTTPGATWYTPASGIWQTVWTEVVDPAHVTNLTLTPVNNQAVKVKVEAANAEGATATVKVLDGNSEVATANVAIGAEASIAINNAKLWSPESPFLYNVKVELKKGNATTDEITSYFGMRKIEIDTLRGKQYVYLNGNPTFSFATLDHGYFPDGIYTPASYDAIRYDLKKLKDLGFNAVRKFEKIEPAIWYHIADSLGLLVWQDIPAAHTGTPIAELNTEEARKANFLRETAAITASIRNFPSIIAWIGFHEDWGRYGYDHVKNTVDLFRGLNDGRLVVPESRDDNYELGDVVSSHGLPKPNMHTNPYNERASICGVTGNYNYVIEGHVWNTTSTSDIKNDSTYAARLKEFTTAAKMLTLQGLSGLAMVQTTDCEEEINGLITYDRKVVKAGPEAEAVLKAGIEFMKTKIASPLLKTSAQGGEVWKYRAGATGTVMVADSWKSDPNFDESEWLEGRSAFGGNIGVSFPLNTVWKGDAQELYVRKKVQIPSKNEVGKLSFQIFHDEDFTFYINGVLACAKTGYVTDYISFDITPEAEAAINYGGENLFAIYIVQTTGGSLLDLGVMGENSRPIDYEAPVETPVWIDIATVQDWVNINNNLSGFYRLTADINLVSSSFRMIGSAESPFRGYLDGQNHQVLCTELTKDGEDRVGLFRYADGAHFVNLRFTDGATLTHRSGNAGAADIGILMGRGKGVTVEHVVFDNDEYTTEVTGADHVGIVAGMLESGKLSTIKDVYVVNASVQSSEWQAGGLVGIICDTRIINSYYTGTVSITREDRANYDNADASGIASRTEGGKNQFKGVMSLATSVESASGNEWVSLNGGGHLLIDSTTCFTRNDMVLDELKAPNRGGQFARATAAMKRPDSDFKAYPLYLRAGWDMQTVWGIPKGGGYPVFRTIPGVVFEDVPDALPEVKKTVNDLKVYATGGNVILSASQTTSVWIYDLQGSLVERTDITGTQTVALPQGIYIVKSAQNGAVKAVKIYNR
jgi:hypothetical protein